MLTWMASSGQFKGEDGDDAVVDYDHIKDYLLANDQFRGNDATVNYDEIRAFLLENMDMFRGEDGMVDYEKISSFFLANADKFRGEDAALGGLGWSLLGGGTGLGGLGTALGLTSMLRRRRPDPRPVSDKLQCASTGPGRDTSTNT